jgi:L-rhamnonate dehydratase
MFFNLTSLGTCLSFPRKIIAVTVTRVGGLTEARRVVALAAAYDIPVIPHGSSVYSYHLQFAYSNCPMGELIVLAPKADKVWPLFGDLFLDEPMPIDGYISLDAKKPGFGVTLNPAVRSTFVRPHPHVSQSFADTEAAKDARTPVQSEWLQRAASRIPIGQADA